MNLKPWLLPPVFAGNEAKTQRARVLYATIVSLCAYLLFLELSLPFGGRIPTANNWMARALFAVCILSYIGLQKGFTRSVSVGLLSMSYVLITISVFNLGTSDIPV